MGTWFNNDGLYIKYGTTEATVGLAGEFSYAGNEHWVELEILATALTASPAIQDDNVTLPSGARIQRVVVIAETACTDSGGTSVLNVGTIRYDRTTASDVDGLVKALPLANLNVAGEQNLLTAGVTYAGDQIGVTLSTPVLLTADYDTEAFTAGRIVVRIYYYVP